MTERRRDMDQLANKIELHLKLEQSPGFHLSDEDQRMIIEALRIAAKLVDGELKP